MMSALSPCREAWQLAGMSDETPGWTAIDGALARVYGEQEPAHFGTVIKWALGGNDPLDGMSAYRRDDHWHYVSYGLSELYEKESEDAETSGYGFELTFRLKCTPGETPPVWPMSLMQNLARYVFTTGNGFAAGHHLNANGPIARDEDTKLTAVLFTEDSELKTIATPHGKVTFLQMVGIAPDELAAVQEWTSDALTEMLAETNPLLLTDLARPSIMAEEKVRERVREGIARDGSAMGELYTSEAHWQREGATIRVTIDALGVQGLKRQLRGRLLHERVLILTGAGEGPEHCVGFAPGETSHVEITDDGYITLFLSRADAEALADRLEAKRGDYTVPSVPSLVLTVAPTDIKNPDGSIAETVG